MKLFCEEKKNTKEPLTIDTEMDIDGDDIEIESPVTPPTPPPTPAPGR